MYVWCATCVQYLKRPEEGIGFPETGVVGGCEPPYGCWGSNQYLQLLSHLLSLITEKFLIGTPPQSIKILVSSKQTKKTMEISGLAFR